MIKKSLVSALAVAVGLAFAPIGASATSMLGTGTKVATEKVVEEAKGKRKAKKKGGKKAASKAGKCGTFKYWNKKTRKCVSKV